MTNETKQQISATVAHYMKEHRLTASIVAKRATVNSSYLNHILNDKFSVIVGEKETVIPDYYFNRLAEFVGVNIKKVYWKMQETDQAVEFTSILKAAKDNCTSGMIIGGTGTGKTYMLDRFIKAYPRHTYRITVSKLHSLGAILEKLLDMLGLNESGRNANKMERIIQHLCTLKHQGEKVQIILDESENLRAPVFGLIKAMYDGIVEHASIILIGTEELIDKMERAKRKNRDGMPQFCRRFKAGTRYLKPIDKTDYSKFFAFSGIKDKGLINLVTHMSDNYGELHDFLEPALREADIRGEELTEDLFRLMNNLPPKK